jgi:PAS domain S-box-containing protein
MQVRLDMNGTVIGFSDPKNILGYEKDELLGKNWFETCLSLSDKPKLEDVFDSLISGKKDYLNYTNDVKCKDGTHKYIDFTNRAISEDDGLLVIESDGVEKFSA